MYYTLIQFGYLPPLLYLDLLLKIEMGERKYNEYFVLV